MKNRKSNIRGLAGRSSQWLGACTIAFSLLTAGHAMAQTSTWNGAFASNSDWSQTANWGGLGVPPANQNLIFGGTTRLTNNNNLTGDTNFASITFDNTAGAFTLNGNRITLGGAVTNNDTDLQTINLAMILSGNRTFDTVSGNLTANGILSGASGAVTKAGAGLLTLGGANSYAGGTTVNAGLLRFANAAARPSTGAVTVAAGAGVSLGSVGAGGYTTADINSLWANTVSNVSLDAISLVGIDTTAGDLSYTTPGTDLTRGLAKVGTGLLTLTGTNAYTGGTRVFGGVLNFDSISARPVSGIVTVDAGSGLALAVGGAGYFTSADIDSLWAGTLSDVTMAATAGVGIDTTQGDLTYATPNSNLGRSFSKVGSGTLTLTTGGTGYTGGTNVFGGTLKLVNTKTGGSNFVTNGILEFNLSSGEQRLNGGGITGSGNLIKSGGNILQLGASGSGQTVALTGASSIIDVQGGILKNDFGNSTWSNNRAGLNVASGATFDTWDGNTTVDELTGSGTIRRNATGANVNGTNTITFGVNDGSGTFSGTISNSSGTLNLTKRGTGTQVFSNSNTYNGITTISAGILSLGNSLAMQNSTLDTLNSAAGDSTNGLRTTVTTLTLGGLIGDKNLASAFTTTSGGYNTLTALTLKVGTGQNRIYSGAIAEGATGMTLTKTGAGFISLSGANTYTGATAVNEGVLGITKSATTTITVAAGAGLALGVGSGLTLYSSADVDALWGNTLSGVTLDPASVMGIDTSAGDFIYSSNLDPTLTAGRQLLKYGANTLRLTGTNTYTTGTVVNSGVLSFANAAARPTTGTVTVAAGAGVSLGSVPAEGYSATNIDSLWANTITDVSIASTSLVGIDTTAGDLTYTTPVTDLTRGLAKVGANTLTLNGASAYTGGTYVGAGRLILVNSKTGSNNFITNGDLEFNVNTVNLRINSGAITGTGNLIKTGTFQLDLGNNASPQTIALRGDSSIIDVQSGMLKNDFSNSAWTNNRAGLTVASGATFNVWDGSATVDELNGAGTITKGLSGGGTLTIGVNNGTGSFSGTLSGGSLALIKNGTGTQTFTGTTSYQAGTTVNGGRLTFVNSKSGSSNFVNNAELEFNVTTAQQQLNGGNLSGTGNLIKSGAGQLWLGGNGSPQTVALTGAGTIIDVQGGTLRNEYGNSAWSGNKAGLIVASGATFDVWDGSATVDEVNGAGTINKGFTGPSTLTIGANDGSGTFSGSITNGVGGMVLVKQGTGTQTLSGPNTYTGATVISNGTLMLTGATQATSAITSSGGGKLGLDIGSSVTAANATVTFTGRTVLVTGTPTLASYTLLTANSIIGTPTLATPAPAGYALQVVGNQLRLVQTDLYLSWAGPGVNFDDDANNDGVDNGLAWLLGAPNKDANATGLLPKSEKVGGGLKLTFKMLPASARSGAQLFLEHSSDLGIGDPWSSGVLVPDATGGTAPVTFSVSGTNPLDVEATVSSSEAAGGKLFSRLKAEK